MFDVCLILIFGGLVFTKRVVSIIRFLKKRIPNEKKVTKEKKFKGEKNKNWDKKKISRGK